MKIESAQHISGPLKEPGCESCQKTAGTETGAQSESKMGIASEIASDRRDRVMLGADQKLERAGVIYRMSEIKKKAMPGQRLYTALAGPMNWIPKPSAGWSKASAVSSLQKMLLSLRGFLIMGLKSLSSSRVFPWAGHIL